MAKTASSEDIALAALTSFLGDPSPRIMHGSKKAPGVFGGAGAKEKAAAKVCVDNSWLAPTGEYEGTGKSRKERYAITAAGVQAVLERTDASAQLHDLNTGIEKLATALDGAAVAIETQVGKLVEQFRLTVKEALKPLEAAAALPEVKQNIAQVLERVKTPDITTLLGKLSTPVPAVSAPALNRSEWATEVIRLAEAQRQRNPFQHLTLPQLFEQLRARHPQLTLGEYHDGLRELHRTGRIRLGPFTQALATIDDGQNALFLDREVKYYVELT